MEQETPEEIKKREERAPRGEANLRGHLTPEGGGEAETSGSSTFVPKETDKDQQLLYAIAWLLDKPTDIKAVRREDAEKAAKEAEGEKAGGDAK